MEAEGLAQSLSERPNEIPLTKEDQAIQIWYKSGFESQKFYERTDFPEQYTDLFSVLQDEAYIPDVESSIILELDSFTFCLVEKQSLSAELGVVSLVLARKNLAVYKQVASVRTWMIIANIGAALLSLVMALLLSRYALKPIQTIIKRAKSITASESMERLPVSKANDEVTALAQTINEMIGGIESSIKTQNQFFASAAHELRTPLANMLAELDLRIGKDLKPQEIALLKSQREEVLRLKYVVQDFLLMSQLKTDTLTLHTSLFRIDELLYDVLEKMNHSIKANGFLVGISLNTRSSLEVNGDQAKTESILVNLIQNAIKYGDNQQPIRIEINGNQNSLELLIQNQIDEKKQAQSGNQLGLWICGKLSEKQGFSFSTDTHINSFTAYLNTPLV